MSDNPPGGSGPPVPAQPEAVLPLEVLERMVDRAARAQERKAELQAHVLTAALAHNAADEQRKHQRRVLTMFLVSGLGFIIIVGGFGLMFAGYVREGMELVGGAGIASIAFLGGRATGKASAKDDDDD